MINKDRLIKAYLLAPLIPTIFVVIFDEINRDDNAGSTSFLTAILSLPLSYVSCLIGGSLLVYLLQSRNILSLWNMVFGGFLMGVMAWYLIGFLFAYLFEYTRELIPTFFEVAWGGLFGVSVALPFGLIAGVPWRINHS